MVRRPGQESAERCDTVKLLGLIAPRWALAKAICIATRFGTSPSLAEQNHRELPSIPIIIKANISQSRRTSTDVMELIKHRPQLAIKKRRARLFTDTEETHRLQWSIAVCSCSGAAAAREPAARPSKLIPLIFEISIF